MLLTPVRAERTAVFASDYPHWDSDFPGTVDEVRRLSTGLGDDVTAKLLGDNAARLYSL